MPARPRGPRQRTLRVETLERRELLASDVFLVNFQNDEASTPTGYLRDTGLLYGDRGGGLAYGWSSDHTDQSRERSLVADQRFDTLIHIEAGQNWNFALPNGTYQVTVAVGDPANNDGLHTINVEGVNLFSAVPDTDGPQVRTTMVTVSDGALTLDQGSAAEKATRIDYVQILGLAAPGEPVPAAPTITSPAAGPDVNPADPLFQAGGYSDPDGDAHRSTDWEVWTVGAQPQLVWQELGAQGAGRTQTRIELGFFQGPLAGQTSLAASTDYELRVRFRDVDGGVSAWASRSLRTAPASQVFPIELADITSAPAWGIAPGGAAVELAPGVVPARLEVQTAAGAELARIEGSTATGNTFVDQPALAQPGAIRVVVQAGSVAFTLAASDLTLVADGRTRTIYLPAISLTTQQRLDLWVSSSGATYYGLPSQTAPSFATLARDAGATPTPYVVNKPGYVIEQVGAGYRLPVNIAFVPDPGPNPNDPLYFVTELYGSIQVVTRDGTKREFATGLLDYNPQGPISGTGEQGLTGIAVRRSPTNPGVYELFVTMLADNGSPPGSATHYPKLERITSVVGGLAMASRTVLLNMQPETQGQSHQISNVSFGPDGKLYVHNGDGFNTPTAQNLDQFRGKILRLNTNGTPASDNPFYNAADGITARDYVWAYGVRNPFGGAWRAADGQHYEVENGPSTDRFAKVSAGQNLGWNGTDTSMRIGALYNWSPATAPVNLTFVQPETFGGSQFPASVQGHAFVSESGSTYAAGPQVRGKKVSEFVLTAGGTLASGPTTLVQYVGSGRGTVVALAAGPDGLYFSEFYEDSGAAGATASGSRIFRVRYVNPLPGDYNIDGVVDQADYDVWAANFGSNLLLAADGNGDGVVDAADYTVWRDHLGQAAPAEATALERLALDEAISATTLRTSETLVEAPALPADASQAAGAAVQAAFAALAAGARSTPARRGELAPATADAPPRSAPQLAHSGPSHGSAAASGAGAEAGAAADVAAAEPGAATARGWRPSVRAARWGV